MSRIFDVQSEKWLKSNTEKTYQDAIDVYYKILENKKKGKQNNKFFKNENNRIAVKNHVECYSFLCILEVAETIL